MPSEVGVIIPAWATSKGDIERLDKCLAHVYHQTVKCDVVVVDNGSDPAVLPGPDTLIRFPENRGYAKAINAGMRLDPHQYNVFLNDDAFLEMHAIENLLAWAKKGIVAMAFTAKDKCPDPTDDMVIGSIDGSCWMISKGDWDFLGPLDEQFGYGGFEDADYWQRMDNVGIKYGVVGNAVAQHLKEATISKLDKMKLYEENKAKFIAKWGVLR